jgi:hypothetical protein
MPPSMSEAWSEPRPSSGCVRLRQHVGVELVELGEQAAPLCRMASTPSSYRLPWAGAAVHHDLDPGEAAVRRA